MTTILDRPRARPALDAPARPGMGFRADVEGLRAVGILLVVAFHASVPGMAGGYVGVDVFFVISGFLITSLLVREGLTRGRISLQDFYARRARRILPAACLVIAVTGSVLTFFVDPLREYRSVLDLGAALFYVSNWRFINQGNDYLAASNDHSPALHFWSLSVEEQFYLVWPLLIVLAVVLARRYRLDLRLVAGAVLAAATAASLWASLALTVSDPNLAYMATFTRAWQFGAGGLLGLLVMGGLPGRAGRRTAAWFLPVVGAIGASAVLVSAVVLDGDTAYPGTAALVPTLGTVALILAGSGDAPSRWSVSGLLATRSMRWIGRMSYAWYLWHWPVIVLVEARWPAVPLSGRLASMAGALALAWATNRILERPMVASRRLRRGHSASYAATALFTVLAGSVLVGQGHAVYADLNQPAPARKLPSFEQVFVQASAATGGATTPTPLRASGDVPEPHHCLSYQTVVVPDGCVFGPEGGEDVVLFGDSHAEQWLTAFRDLAEEQGWRLHVVTQGSCAAADVSRTEFGNTTADQPYCFNWRNQEFERWKELRPSYVFLSSSMPFFVGRDPVEAWSRTFAAVRAAGAQPVYVWDTPSPPSDVPACVAGSPGRWGECDFSIGTGEQVERFRAERRAVSSEPGLIDVNLTDGVLCRELRCPAVRDGILLYRDYSHVSDTAVRILQPELERQLARQGVIPGRAGQPRGERG